MMTTTQNPFAVQLHGGIQAYTCSADDRISRVQHFDRKQCLAALALPDLQRTVARAVERRLRQLERGLA